MHENCLCSLCFSSYFFIFPLWLLERSRLQNRKCRKIAVLWLNHNYPFYNFTVPTIKFGWTTLREHSRKECSRAAAKTSQLSNGISLCYVS